MESSSDKQLREKLSGNEFPFDPQAWEQMEAMLDEKKKRRGFFWWWTGGIAASLLLVLFGYELRELRNGAIAAINSNTPKTETKTSYPDNKQGTTNSETLGSEKTEEKNANELFADRSNSQVGASGTMKTLAEENSKSKMTAQNSERAKSHSPTLLGRHHAKSRLKHSGVATNARVKKKLNQIANAQLNGQDHQPNYVAVEETPFKKEIEMLHAAAQKSGSNENINLNRREAALLESVSENAEAGFDKKENEDLLPKKKKVIFHYSLGVLANVTGSTVGNQDGNSLFYNKPSYMVGFTHDFLFLNRIAITNAILFSQTSFKVYAPKTVSFTKAPSDYTSNITELVIPIGIKVYPVVKNNFRFYINLGIINHIKLKETFTYTMPADTVVPNLTTANVFDPNSTGTIPTQTDFTGNGYPYQKLNTSGVATTEQVNTSDFSINNAKRYYASFYASAGFEFILKKHFVLYTEPLFFTSLQKIGVQEKRKYNLGLSGGFRYQF